MIPYLIFAPSYTYKSSGVKALHFLCHRLNKLGHRAYIWPQDPQGFGCHPDLDTPILPPQTHNYFLGNDIDPIIVYPDTTQGNPLNAKRVVRYLLAPAGKYGGSATFPATDKVWCYRSEIAGEQNTDKILTIPVWDESIFYPPPKESMRRGICYYSHKYDRIHGNKLPDMGLATRLEGTPERLAQILRASEKCLVFEPTEVHILASLCGCPAKEVITPYFQGMGEQPDIFRDDKVIPMPEMMGKFRKQLDLFIKDTQTW